MNIKKSAVNPADPPQPTPDEPPPPQKKRKRGAQPGNKNALKHGLYTERSLYPLRGSYASPDLQPTPPAQQDNPNAPNVPEDSLDNRSGNTAFGDPDDDLDTKWEKIKAWLEGKDERPFVDLQLEIDLIRMAIRYVASMPQPQSLAEAIQLLRALSLATTSLARLIRTQYYVTPPTGRKEIWSQEVDRGLVDIAKELNLRV